MEILFQDDWLVAVNKPAGMLVHRSGIDRHETVFALQQVRNQLGRRVYPVHRLDKPTAGVLLFALDRATARGMAGHFSTGRVRKRYLAVVRGYLHDEGVIDYPLIEEQDAMTDALADPAKAAQPAVTAFRCLQRVELAYPVGRYDTTRYSLAEVVPQTGRKHQIRRHMKHIFHPIVGDSTHGDGRQNAFFRQHFGCHRLLLAATGMAFPHPVHGGEVNLSASLDTSFIALLSAMGWHVEDGVAA